MNGDITGGQNRQSRRSRPAAKPAKPEDGWEKIMLLLSKETNVKLSTLAALKGVDRSQFDPDRGPAGRRDLAERRAGINVGAGEGGEALAAGREATSAA